MIHDSASRLSLYRPLSPHIGRAIDFINASDLAALSPGRHEVDGDRVFALIFHTDTLAGGARWESHRRYIDLQWMVEGHERQEVADVADLSGATPFDVEKDVGFYAEAKRSNLIDLRSGQFVIFFPHDGHRPMIAPREPAPIRKLVLKILVG